MRLQQCQILGFVASKVNTQKKRNHSFFINIDINQDFHFAFLLLSLNRDCTHVHCLGHALPWFPPDCQSAPVDCLSIQPDPIPHVRVDYLFVLLALVLGPASLHPEAN